MKMLGLGFGGGGLFPTHYSDGEEGQGQSETNSFKASGYFLLCRQRIDLTLYFLCSVGRDIFIGLLVIKR